jgi:hypothetical protein
MGVRKATEAASIMARRVKAGTVRAYRSKSRANAAKTANPGECSLNKTNFLCRPTPDEGPIAQKFATTIVS